MPRHRLPIVDGGQPRTGSHHYFTSRKEGELTIFECSYCNAIMTKDSLGLYYGGHDIENECLGYKTVARVLERIKEGFRITRVEKDLPGYGNIYHMVRVNRGGVRAPQIQAIKVRTDVNRKVVDEIRERKARGTIKTPRKGTKKGPSA